MLRGSVVVGLVVAMLMSGGTANAQQGAPQGPPRASCEEQLRTVEQLAGIWARSRQQAESELAATRAQLEEARRQLEERKAPPPAKGGAP